MSMSASERPIPAPEAMQAPLTAWWAGDGRPLAALIRGLKSLDLELAKRLWWELSTLGGNVIGRLDVVDGQKLYRSLLDGCFISMTGGGPRTVADLGALRELWLAFLDQAPTLAAHHRALRLTLDSLLAGTHPHPDAAFILARHHSDEPVSIFAGRPILGPEGYASVDSVRHELLALSARLRVDQDLSLSLAEAEHSPSNHRRDLAWRLRHLPAT